MNITYGMPILAQQTTGHPAALPAEPQPAPADRQVSALSNSSDTGDARAGQSEGEPAAPPSAMQRKIMEILERQAEALEDS